jgi:hypothetical protein
MRKPTTGKFNSLEELETAISDALKLGLTWRQVASATGVSDTKALQVHNAYLKKIALQALKDSPCPPIPEHHVQWFETLKLAAANGHLALMSARDTANGESRSVICIANIMEDGTIWFIPVGNLATTEDPFDAYIPPKEGQGSIQ